MRLFRFGAMSAVLLSIVTPALAQSISCTAFSAGQPGVRKEGAAEPIGDVILSCAGTVSGARFTGPQTLSLSGNFAIAGRERHSSAPDSADLSTEASLLVNDCTTDSGYSPSSPSFSCANNDTFTSGIPTPGFLENGALIFSGFTLPMGINELFQLHLTNLRVNPGQLAAGTSMTGAIHATFPVQYSSGLVLGVVTSDLRDPASPKENSPGCRPVFAGIATPIATGPCAIAGNPMATSGKSIGTLSSQPPSVVSLSPSAGGGLLQTFTFSFSDPLGYQDFAYQQVIINSVLSPGGGCFIYYSPSNNQVYLGTDSGSGALGPATLGASGTLQNSQCSLNVGSSSAFGAGDDLTLSLALTFVGGFSGLKTIWALTASNEGATNGWQTMGTWTPANPVAPTVTSVTPSSGAGSSQTFSFLFADVLGYQDFAYQQVIINSTLSPSGGCFIYYSPSNNQVYLGTDSGSGALGPATLGVSGTLQNSQCILNLGSSGAVGSGNNLTLNLALTFESGFTGIKTLWALAASNDGVNSGWLGKGTWTPASPPVPSVVSVTPSSGSGLSQTFSFVFADAAGYQDMEYQQVIINTTLSPGSGCYVYYSPSSNSVYMQANGATLGPQALGSSATMQNSQCSLNLGASSASGSGNNLTLNLALTFQASFNDQLFVWAIAASYNGLNSGWQSVGTWAPTGLTPSALLFPPSGSGTYAPFELAFEDPVGYKDIASAQIIINSTLNLAGGCNFLYEPGSQSIYIYNDAGTGTTGTGTGTNGATLSNSQCSLDAAETYPANQPYFDEMNLILNFAAGFTGAKTVWANVTNIEGLSSGWQSIGAWAPSNPPTPAVTSVVPSSGSGLSQTFSVTFTDTLTYHDFSYQQVLINSSLTPAGGCFVYYSPSNNQIYLGTNSGSGTVGNLTLGTTGTLQNSQCSLNVGSSSVVTSGNNLTLNLALTFESGFTGAQTIWAFTNSNEQLNSGWVNLGTWTP